MMNNHRRAARTYHDLIVWQKAHRLVLAVYQLVGHLPGSERYVLDPQLRRAAISVPANLAEGFRKRGKSDKSRFVNISHCSLDECRYYLELIRDLGYCDPSPELLMVDEISRLLSSYDRQLRRNEGLG
jgi:four helix bundle protein